MLVTRAAADAASLVAGLRKLGAEPVLVPLVERVTYPRQVAAIAKRGHHGWVLTSAAAVPALAQVEARPDWIAAVGPATARAGREAGLHVDLVPDEHTAEALALALGDRTGQRVLYPRAANPSPGTLDALRATGAVLDDVIAYDNVEPQAVATSLARAWPVDVVTALSGSVVRRLAAHCPPPWPVQTRLVVIGPKTEAVALQHGLTPHAVAEPHTVHGLLHAVARVLGAR